MPQANTLVFILLGAAMIICGLLPGERFRYNVVDLKSDKLGSLQLTLSSLLVIVGALFAGSELLLRYLKVQETEKTVAEMKAKLDSTQENLSRILDWKMVARIEYSPNSPEAMAEFESLDLVPKVLRNGTEVPAQRLSISRVDNFTYVNLDWLKVNDQLWFEGRSKSDAVKGSQSKWQTNKFVVGSPILTMTKEPR